MGITSPSSDYIFFQSYRRVRQARHRNLLSHKRASTIQAIEAVGAQVELLPLYSPDLNPIKNVFSKIKNRLRSMACRAREQLWGNMQTVLYEVTLTDGFNCFCHCGYTLQVM